jgi:hypothetical protein
MDTTINAMQERVEAAITSIHSDFEEAVSKQMEGIMVSVSWQTQGLLRGAQY